MDLLKTLLFYMALVFASSVQSMPDADTVMEAILTPPPATETPTPVPTPTPTPVPTVAISPNPDYKTLRFGDKGDLVIALQQSLTQYGYYTGDLDGKYGNQTRQAVERFQYNHGLSADGIAGKNTLTVLYDSDQVRYAQATPSPTPEGKTLTVAVTPGSEAAGASPSLAPEPTVAATPSATPTITPTPTVTFTPIPPLTPTPGATEAPTVAPVAKAAKITTSATATPTPLPDFLPMSGWTIYLAGSEEPVTHATGAQGAPPAIRPYAAGDVLFIPLVDVLEANGMVVLTSDDIVNTEYAFALGTDLYRVSFTETQDRQPSNLNVYKNNVKQILPLRLVNRADGVAYLPADSITRLTGITFARDEEKKIVTVTFLAQDSAE